ncbi:MAG: TrmH family RNA methyltransferase [Acidimicrobiales bacterium]
MASPRDRYLTIYGRKAVLEALENGLAISRVFLADTARGEVVDRILAETKTHGVQVQRVSDRRVSSISGNSRQDQGVVADVPAPRMQPLMSFLEQRTGSSHATAVLVLDGITNPSNLGMILRTATAAGLDGIVVPETGTATVGPLVIKASAGVAFVSPILRIDRTEYALAQLADARFEIVSVDVEGPSVFEAELSDRVALVLGNESVGISEEARGYAHSVVSLPLASDVESLNVSAAAAVVCYELVRRRTTS